ncbi:MAG: IPT/TIG domain-containing protein [Cyanobacteria bacterium TGS_CYA1]|nr:IPT/TIG domain-containing protein [Cyanobacteria bacterium TGS_CYA1]
MMKTRAILVLPLFFMACCPTSAVGENMAVLQESKPLVTRAGAWHTWNDHIHLKAGQDKRSLSLIFTNGVDGRPKFTDLAVELNRKPFATFKNFSGGDKFTLDLTGQLSTGNTPIMVKGFGPSGARLNWKVFISRPEISEVKPDPMSAVDKVTILGKNFSERPEQVKVYIGKKHVKPLNSTEGKIEFMPLALQESSSTNLIVAVSEVKSAPVRVTMRSLPHIKRINLLAAPPEHPVIISGSGFSPVVAENVVTFGKIKAHVISATESSITCIIPNMHFPKWHVPIVVTTNGIHSKERAYIHVDVRLIENEGVPMR